MSPFVTQTYRGPQQTPNITEDLGPTSSQRSRQPRNSSSFCSPVCDEHGGRQQSIPCSQRSANQLHPRNESGDTDTILDSQRYSEKFLQQNGMYPSGLPRRVPSVTDQSQYGPLRHPAQTDSVYFEAPQDHDGTHDAATTRASTFPRGIAMNPSLFEYTTLDQAHSGIGFRPDASSLPVDSGQSLSAPENGRLRHDAFASEYMPPFYGFFDVSFPFPPKLALQSQDFRSFPSLPEDYGWVFEASNSCYNPNLRQIEPAGSQQDAWDSMQALPYEDHPFLEEPQLPDPNTTISPEQTFPYLSTNAEQHGTSLSLPPAALQYSSRHPPPHSRPHPQPRPYFPTYQAHLKQVGESTTMNGAECAEHPFPTFPPTDISQTSPSNVQVNDPTIAQDRVLNSGSINGIEKSSQQSQKPIKRTTGGLRDYFDPRQSLRSVPRDRPQWKLALGLNYIKRPVRPARQDHFPLMRLPPELRNIVYRHIFVSPNGIGAAAIAAPQFFRAARSFVNRNFLLTCRQVYRESAHIFYCENLFAFAYVGAFLTFLKCLSMEQRQLLTKLRLSYAQGNIERALTIIVKDCHHLRGLEIRIRSAEGGPGKWTWNAAPILSPIDVVRGLVSERDVKLGPVITVREEVDGPLSYAAVTDMRPESLHEFLHYLGEIPMCFRSAWNPSNSVTKGTVVTKKLIPARKKPAMKNPLLKIESRTD